MNKCISLNVKFLSKTVCKCGCWIHITIFNKSNCTTTRSKNTGKYTSVCVAGLCCMRPCWHSLTPWKIWCSLIQNHPWMLRVTPFIYKASDRFTDSTTKHQSSQKTKVNWKLFQEHFLVFLSFLPSPLFYFLPLFNIGIFLRFPYSTVLKHEFQCLLIYPKYLVQWIVLFTLPSSFISFHWPS